MRGARKGRSRLHNYTRPELGHGGGFLTDGVWPGEVREHRDYGALIGSRDRCLVGPLYRTKKTATPNPWRATAPEIAGDGEWLVGSSRR
jgi:hypothetical protein